MSVLLRARACVEQEQHCYERRASRNPLLGNSLRRCFGVVNEILSWVETVEEGDLLRERGKVQCFTNHQEIPARVSKMCGRVSGWQKLLLLIYCEFIEHRVWVFQGYKTVFRLRARTSASVSAKPGLLNIYKPIQCLQISPYY